MSETSDAKCPRCKGAKKVKCPVCNGDGLKRCPRCHGTGTVVGSDGGNHVCQSCRGSKEVKCTECDPTSHQVTCWICKGTGEAP